MDTDPHDTSSGMVLVLGMGFLNWLLNDDEARTEDQISFGGSADAGYRAGETPGQDESETNENRRAEGVNFTPEDRMTDEDRRADEPRNVDQSSPDGPVDDTDEGSAEKTTEADAPPREGEDSTADSHRSKPATAAEDRPAEPRADDELADQSSDVTAAELDARIDEIESEIERLSQTVETLDRDFDSLQSSLGTIETDLEQLITQAHSTLAEQKAQDQSTNRDGSSAESADVSPPGVAEEETDMVEHHSTPSMMADDSSVTDDFERNPTANAFGTSGDQKSAGADGADQFDRTTREQEQPDVARGRSSDEVQNTLGDGGADLTSTGNRSVDHRIETEPPAEDQQRRSLSENPSSAAEHPTRGNSTEPSESDTGDWPPEKTTTDSSVESTETTGVGSTISEVTDQVSERMGRIVDGEEATNSLTEPTATVVGTGEQPKESLPDDGNEDTRPTAEEDTAVEDIDQLLESDDWAVDLDDLDVDEADLDEVIHDELDSVETDPLEAVESEPQESRTDAQPVSTSQDTTETLAEETVDGDSSERAVHEDLADPAQLAASASPAEAVQTYVEEGDPEKTSVDPDSSDSPFEFGKVLMPNDDEPDLPELVGADVKMPYLEALPEGYATDSLAIEWVGWLVNEGDPASAVDLILYYEEAGWLGERATDDLLAYLEGLVDLGDAPSDGTLETYDLEAHLHGLEYIKEISNDPSLSEVTTDGV